MGERGPYRKGVQRRQQIVRAATEVFAGSGYHGGSLRTIADRVGVSSATLVQYFGTKEGLLAAVLEQWATDSTVPGATQLRGLAWVEGLRAVMRYNAAHRGLIQLFLTLATEATDPGHPAADFVRQRYARGVADFAAHLREAIADGEITTLPEADVEPEARLFFATMDGIELQWLLDPSQDLVELFDRHLDQTLVRWRFG